MSIHIKWEASYKSYRAERMKELVNKLGNGMTKACLIVERQAKENCPVDTGRLRASITSQTKEEREGVVGGVGTNVIYAKFVEFGTSRMSPHPFLFPALEMKKGAVKSALEGG